MADTRLNGEVNNAYEIDDPMAITSFDREPAIHKAEFQLDPLRDLKPTKSSKLKKTIILILKVLVHVAVVGYFAYATYYYVDIQNHECSKYAEPHPLCGIQFCNGYGMLVLLVVLTYLGLFYYYIFKPTIGRRMYRSHLNSWHDWWMTFSRKCSVSSVMFIALLIAIAMFLYFETKEEPSKLIALIAPLFFILTGYVFSTNRRAIKWRIVITGIAIQFLLGIFCIRWEVGRQIFQCFGQKMATFLAFSDSGSRFVFGDHLIDEGVFAFAILPVIFFFSFFISILYYFGTMQWIVTKLGWIIQQLMGTTVCESVTAAANIFLGMSESPFLIQPYIKLLTASELHAVMASGFATVSGTVMAAYLSFGASAAHLITSTVMAAPATLAFSKLYLPETEESKTSSDNIELAKSENSSVLDAATSGASSAIPIVLGIIANIVAFVSFIAFANAIINWLGYLVGVDGIDFEWIFSKIFIPLAWAMGVPTKDCDIIAKVVATKTIINEFVAYERLGMYTKNGDIEARSASIATFAICGFANPSSLGILIGSLGAMAPNRRGVITSVALRAFFVGSLVCFVSASFAGILIQNDEEERLYEKIFNTMERKNITIAFFKEQS